MLTLSSSTPYTVTLQQQAGAIAPACTVRIAPNNANPFDPGVLNFVPENLLIRYGEQTWEFEPTDTQIEVDPESVGVEYEIQYYPKLLKKLNTEGYEKHLVYLSCSRYEYKAIIAQYDDAEYVVLHKETDVYCSNGWTVNDIIKDVSLRSGIPILSTLPTLHVPNPSVIFKKGDVWLQFIQALLPQDGLTYLWQGYGESLTITMLTPHEEPLTTFPPGVDKLTLIRREVTPYTLVEITGGDYKPGYQYTLGIQGKAGRSLPTITTRTETLEPQEQTIQQSGRQQITETVRTSRYWGDLFFAIDAEEITVQSGQVDRAGVTQQQRVSKTVKTWDYENNDPHTYRTPRQTQLVTKISGFVTLISLGLNPSVTTEGPVSYLTEDNQILSYAEYHAIAPSRRPNIQLTAYEQYIETIETQTEQFSYIHYPDMTAMLTEGMQTQNTVNVRRLCVGVNGMYYDARVHPRELLMQVQANMTSMNQATATTAIMNTLTTELITRNIKTIHEDAYQFEETRATFDFQSNKMRNRMEQTTIDAGRVPSAPSQYRVERLKATAIRAATKTEGNATLPIITFQANIPTNNPQDFELWAGLLYYQVTHPQREYSMTSQSRVFLPGTRLSGCTITSYAITEHAEEGVSITMTGVA